MIKIFRYEMYKRIDADYYGYRDEEDGVLLPLEKEAEQAMRAKAINEWNAIEAVKNAAKKTVKSGDVARVKPLFFDEEETLEEDNGSDDETNNKARTREFVAHVPLPDEKEIERMVVEKKKLELLSKYTSETLVEEQQEAKNLLNIQR
jgi:pre-mRNA-splicing factor ISY1